jgi:hypothetical protein
MWNGSDWVCKGLSGNGTVTRIDTVAPLVGGPITTSGTISMTAASASTDGYLTKTDYIRFSNKQDALGYTPVNRAGDSMTGALNLPSNGLSVGGNQLVVSGGNVSISGSLIWGGSNALSTDQTGSIELGNSTSSGTTPFIDFHYGKGTAQDYNVRIINDADGRLNIVGNLLVSGTIKSTTGQGVYTTHSKCANAGALTINSTCQTICCYYDSESGSCMGYYNCSGTCQYWVYNPYTCNNTLVGKLISP